MEYPLRALRPAVASGQSGRKAAIAWLADARNPWAIAIVALILEPGGGGFGVLPACRERRPGQKAVVLTATANPDVRRHCEALGCDGVFDKSMETDALMDYCLALTRAARGRPQCGLKEIVSGCCLRCCRTLCRHTAAQTVRRTDR